MPMDTKISSLVVQIKEPYPLGKSGLNLTISANLSLELDDLKKLETLLSNLSSTLTTLVGEYIQSSINLKAMTTELRELGYLAQSLTYKPSPNGTSISVELLDASSFLTKE